jgi:hypothetical protein
VGGLVEIRKVKERTAAIGDVACDKKCIRKCEESGVDKSLSFARPLVLRDNRMADLDFQHLINRINATRYVREGYRINSTTVEDRGE